MGSLFPRKRYTLLLVWSLFKEIMHILSAEMTSVLVNTNLDLLQCYVQNAFFDFVLSLFDKIVSYDAFHE